MDLTLNNLQRLICHKTQQTKRFCLLALTHCFVVLGCGFFVFSILISIQLGSSNFSVFSVSIWVGKSYLYASLFAFSRISNIIRSKNQLSFNISSLVNKSLTCCIKSNGFCTLFYHSFSILSLCWIPLKITVKYIFVVFSGPFFPLASLSWVVALVIDCVLEIRSANIHKLPINPPCRLSREHLPIMTPRSVVWVPWQIRFGFVIFYWLYCGLIIICALVTVETWYSFKIEETLVGHSKNQPKTLVLNLLSFNFVKV